jgi:hypothetical protein
MSRCIPIQTNVNTAEPFFALAGGGGEADPNPKVSTLSFAEYGKGNGVMNISTSLVISDATTPRGGLNFQLYPSINGFNTYVFPSTTSAIFMRSPNTQTQLAVGAGDDGKCYVASIDNATDPAELTVAGASIHMSTSLTSMPTTASISSLTVSSINGAAAVSASDYSTLQGQVAALMVFAGL